MLDESIQRIVQKTGRSAEEARASLASNNPQGRIIQPQEVADAVLYLCSDSAISVNGHALAISGGATW
jgi:NAD(P)-dependent dehydrogenase (short-subunit alcohol dehydrogenase family)